MKKIKLATILLGDYQNSHGSCLDLDEWLTKQSDQVDLIHSSSANIQEYPEKVDIALIEGTVTNRDDLLSIHKVGDRSKIIISFGDCANTDDNDNLRELIDETESIFQMDEGRVVQNQDLTPEESETLSNSLKQLLRVHEIVEVDVYLPDCPPNAGQIFAVLEMLLAGEVPHLAGKLNGLN